MKNTNSVVTSCVKKGLVTTSGCGEESTVRLTEAGFAAYLATR